MLLKHEPISSYTKVSSLSNMLLFMRASPPVEELLIGAPFLRHDVDVRRQHHLQGSEVAQLLVLVGLRDHLACSVRLSVEGIFCNRSKCHLIWISLSQLCDPRMLVLSLGVFVHVTVWETPRTIGIKFLNAGVVFFIGK